MGFEINEDRAIVCAFAFRPIIHAKDTRCGMCRWRRLAHHANECRWTRRHAESLAQTGTSFTANGKGNHLKKVMQTNGFPRKWLHHTRQTPGEYALAACGRVTEELPNVEHQSNGIAAPRSEEHTSE